MKHNNTKALIVPIIAVVMFLLLIFGATYAYFTSTVTLNNANYQITMPSTTSLICTKTDCNVTITPAMMTNTNTNNSVAKATSNCAISCTCSGTQGAVCAYDVYLNESGTTYTPSASIGNEKEFTAKITTQSGCTAQNSSNVETQINTLRGNTVAACSLTVPQGGSITSNVYAEFKWYNLPLDQSTHANKIYNYQLTNEGGNSSQVETDIPFNSQTGTGTIYRWSTDTASLGSNISVLTSGYETDISNISTPHYLKHTIENNIITESYACVKYTEGGVLKEACVQGGDPSYYGTYDGMSSTSVSSVTGATGNIKKIQSIQNYVIGTLNGLCSYSGSYSTCYCGSSLDLHAYSDGHVYVDDSSTGRCYVNSGGSAYCNSGK